MNTSDYKLFYAELGKLLYAVADIDHVITAEEKKTLHEQVRKALVPEEKHKDAFGSDVAFYTEMEFDVLDEQIADARTAFRSFIDFMEEHKTSIEPRLKQACIHLAEQLAAAYHGTNKAEEELLHELKKKLAGK